MKGRILIGLITLSLLVLSVTGVQGGSLGSFGVELEDRSLWERDTVDAQPAALVGDLSSPAYFLIQNPITDFGQIFLSGYQSVDPVNGFDTDQLIVAAVQAAPQETAKPATSKFPGGISPSHVYAKMIQLRETVQVLLKAKSLTPPDVDLIAEQKLGPLHVYQLTMASLSRVQEFGEQVGILRLPTVVGSPRKIAPRDVKYLADMMLSNLQQAATALGVDDNLPTEAALVSGKTPNDVFHLIAEIFVALNRLAGHAKVSPNEVYGEMIRAVADVRAILNHLDTASRYRIDVPSSPTGLKPKDALAQCLAIRQAINQLYTSLALPERVIPAAPTTEVRPVHVFLQTQVIIAELNRLKMAYKTSTSTPLSIPVTDKTPSHVHQQGALAEHLLKQVPEIMRYASR